jgi:outer membrane protein OmpA-like peptidoglycan-associated protein
MKTISFLLFLFIAQPLFAQHRTEMTVHFDFNKTVIRPVDAALLDSLVTTFTPKAKNIKIEIYGHCDSKGSNSYNDILSVKRVKSVEKYLLARAVKMSSISKEHGYGSQKLLADVSNSNADIINRRVELVITTSEEKTEEKSFTKMMDDTATKAGSSVILKNMSFIGGSHHLLKSSYSALQELFTALKNNENLVIQIEGHICCLAGAEDGYDDDTHTKNLSEERAKEIYTYLTDHGIAAARLSYKGYGHTKPLYPYPEKTKLEELLNRRVEIKIIKK